MMYNLDETLTPFEKNRQEYFLDTNKPDILNDKISEKQEEIQTLKKSIFSLSTTNSYLGLFIKNFEKEIFNIKKRFSKIEQKSTENQYINCNENNQFNNYFNKENEKRDKNTDPKQLWKKINNTSDGENIYENYFTIIDKNYSNKLTLDNKFDKLEGNIIQSFHHDVCKNYKKLTEKFSLIVNDNKENSNREIGINLDLSKISNNNLDKFWTGTYDNKILKKYWNNQDDVIIDFKNQPISFYNKNKDIKKEIVKKYFCESNLYCQNFFFEIFNENNKEGETHNLKNKSNNLKQLINENKNLKKHNYLLTKELNKFFVNIVNIKEFKNYYSKRSIKKIRKIFKEYN